MQRKPDMTPISFETLSRIAWIVGPCSAAAQAIENIRQRTERGETVVCLCGGGMYLVVSVERKE